MMKSWIYENHICELRRLSEEIIWRKIITVIYTTYAVAKRKPEENSGLNVIWTLWPLPYQCSALPIKLTSHLDNTTCSQLEGRGQGFKSHTSLNFFQAFFSQLHKLPCYYTMWLPILHEWQIMLTIYCCFFYLFIVSRTPRTEKFRP